MSTGPLKSLWAKKTQAPGGAAEDTAQPLKDSGNLPREKLSLAQTGSTKPLQDSVSDKDGAASEKSGKQSSEGKKRKRTQFTLQQKEKLGAAFARTHHPTAAECLALSAETKLDKTQIANWFDHARRKRSRLGGAPGRNVQPAAQPAKAPAGRSVVVLDDDDEEELPEAASSAPLPDVPQQRQQHQAEGSAGLMPDVAACDNVHEPMDTGPCEEQQPDPGAGHPAAAGVDSVPEAAATDPVAVNANVATAAAGSQPEADVGPANSDNPLWSAGWCADKRAHYEREMARLSTAVEQQLPLRPLPDQPLMALNKPELASLLAGCVHPIGRLLELLHHESAPFNREALRNCIMDIATRKNFAPKEGKGAEIVDAISDEAAGSLWRWELRNLHFLPKGLQPEYKQLKKNLQEAGNLLTALHGVCRALQDVEAGKGRAKAEKALAKLAKLPASALLQQQSGEAGIESPRSSLPQQEFAGPNTSQLLASPRVSQLPGLGGSPAGRAQDAADKESQKQARQVEREQQQQEREAKRKEKEAEKERLRKEKEAQKAEKEAQRERQRLEKEKEKEQQKQERKLKHELAGFGSVTTIQKSRNALTRFLKKTPAAALTSAAAATPHTRSPIKIRDLEATLSPQQAAAVREAAGAAKARTARIDAELTRQKASPESARENRRSLLERWKLVPRHRRLKGLPPTWARRLHAPARPLEFEDDEVTCETWRRKFLWFPAEADDSGFFTAQPHWPPYYGSWSKTSKVINPRRPFARDPQLDYDFMEDEEWEPEPEGETLSADEADDEDVGMEDSANDGFFVSDGQLSDDEGLSSVQQDIDELCAEQEEDAVSGPAAGVDQNLAASEAQRRLLEAALRKSLPRPLIISRLPTAADVSGYSGCLCGDASLLSALSMQVVAANVRIELPAGLEEEELTEAGPGSGRVGRPSGPAGERPEELLPDLIRFLQGHPEIKAVPKLVQAFCDAWPERKLVKKWVTDKVKEVADRGVAGWRIKAEALAAAGMEVPEAAAAPAQPVAPEGSLRDVVEGSPKKAAAGGMLKFVGKGEQPSQAAPREKPVHPIDNGSKRAAPQAIKGTADPQWKALVDSLVQPASSYTEEKVSRLFSALSRMDSTAAVPAFVPIAMLKTLGSCGAPMILRESCARNLAMLVTMMASEPRQPKSPPHKVWGEARSAPKPASLEVLFAEAKLRITLLDCIQSPNIDLAKSAAMLLGALVSVGSPQKLGAVSEDKAEPQEVPVGVSLAATAFRSEIAGEAQWVEVLTATDAKSTTLASYKMLALCHLLHDEMCIDSLLEEPQTYNRVLLQCLTSAGLQNPGCAKYGIPGLMCLVQWHETAERPFSAAAGGPYLAGPRTPLERLLRVLLQRVQDRSQLPAKKDSRADNLRLIAIEVARMLGEMQHKHGKPIASAEGKTAEEREIRDDLLAALAVQQTGPESVGQQAAKRAREALMRC